MTQKAGWTASKIDALKLREGETDKRVAIDTGLFIRLRAKKKGQSKNWEYRAQVNGRRSTLRLGKYSKAGGLAWARARIAELTAQADRARIGEADHPAISERHKRDSLRTDPTVAELFDSWTEDMRLLGKRERTIFLHRSNFENDVLPRIGDAKVRTLEIDAIEECIDKVKRRGALGQAAQVYKSLRAFVNFALSKRHLKSDPMAALKNPKPYNPRQGEANAANDREIIALLDTLDESRVYVPVRLAIHLQLLTGARPSEVREATWSEFDLDNSIWTIPANRVKTNREFRIHLSQQSLAVLRAARQIHSSDDYVFPGMTERKPLSNVAIVRALARLGERVESANGRRLTPHDLRRTFRTLLSRLAVPPHIAERCLNHTPTNALERAYDAHSYREEMVIAWEKVGTHIQALRTGGAQIVRLRA